MKASIVTVNGHSISYLEAGEGKETSVIFIHGFPFNKRSWEPQIEALHESYHVIAYDVRGHGDSTEGTVEFSIDLFTLDLIGLMDALEINRAVICGLSMGGYIALHAISKYPDRFSALILSDTQCIADSEEGKQKRMAAIENIKAKGVDLYADESIKKLFAPASHTTHPDQVASIHRMITKTSVYTLMQTLLALANRAETCTKLAGINVPCLIMVGAEDPITPPSAAQFMTERIKDAELQIIDHAAHLPNLERANEFNTHLVQFLIRVTDRNVIM
jgi:3-oxoadipate enol-lactonase